jgi:hypothetical protein
METEIRELPRTPAPLPVVYATAVLCGLMAAMVVEILLARRGIELAGAGRNILSTRALQLRAAGAWWLMVGAALVTSAAAAGALSRLPRPWTTYRGLRWLAGAAIVFGLAHVGHLATFEATRPVAAHVSISLIALAAAGLMALLGAYFAAKR